jgi:hypothetical protein
MTLFAIQEPLLGVHLGEPPGPRRRLLKLTCHPDQHVFPAVGGHELDADRQPA